MNDGLHPTAAAQLPDRDKVARFVEPLLTHNSSVAGPLAFLAQAKAPAWRGFSWFGVPGVQRQGSAHPLLGHVHQQIRAGIWR